MPSGSRFLQRVHILLDAHLVGYLIFLELILDIFLSAVSTKYFLAQKFLFPYGR